MKPVTDGLDLSILRHANLLRLPNFRNSKGELVHSKKDGSDWALSKWGNAAFGEVGEAANIIKKIERGDFSKKEAAELLGKELADIIIYVDILAKQLDIDLSEAIVNKFNEVSIRVNSPVRLSIDGVELIK